MLCVYAHQPLSEMLSVPRRVDASQERKPLGPSQTCLECAMFIDHLVMSVVALSLLTAITLWHTFIGE